jgi:hypothetical protein
MEVLQIVKGGFKTWFFYFTWPWLLSKLMLKRLERDSLRKTKRRLVRRIKATDKRGTYECLA